MRFAARLREAMTGASMRGVIYLVVFAATVVPALAAMRVPAAPELGVEGPALLVAAITGLALFVFRRGRA